MHLRGTFEWENDSPVKSFSCRIWSNCKQRAATCMRAHVAFEVKGVVEAFAAEAAQMSLCLVVTLDVSV